MSDKSSSSGGGISFLGMLTILFIGLKLTGHIDWSWWWVLCPIWAVPAGILAGLCAYFSITAAVGLMALIWLSVEDRLQKRKTNERK